MRETLCEMLFWFSIAMQLNPPLNLMAQNSSDLLFLKILSVDWTIHLLVSSWSAAFSWQVGCAGGPKKFLSHVLGLRVACYLGYLSSTSYLSLLLRLPLHWRPFLQSLYICWRISFITLQHGSWAPKQRKRKLLGFSRSSASAMAFWSKRVTANPELRGEETDPTSC